jgi:hypothetical protein
MCCSFVITCVRVFFNSPTQFHLWSRDWGDVLLFDSCVRVFFSLPNSHLWSRDWVMCCSFVITRVRVFFNSPTQFPPMKQGLSDVLLFCDYTRVKSIFNSPTQFPPMKQGLVMCCSFCDYMCDLFQQSYPIPTYKAGIEWCAALLWLHVLEYFSTVLPNSTYEAGLKWCCSFLWLHVLEYFSTVHPIP